MKTLIYSLIIVSSLAIISCKSKTNVAEKVEEECVLPENVVEMNDDQIKMAALEFGTIELKSMSGILKANGLINVPPQNLISISASMGGYIKSTDLLQGSPVTKGQVLAVVENQEFIELQQSYLESRNSLEYAEAEYNRQNDLHKENINSTKSLQQAVSEYKNLKTKVFALEQKLSLIGINAKSLSEDKISRSISVVSPISGYVKSVNVNIGKYVNPTDVMFEIVNNQKLTLELSLFEKDITRVNIGQKIRFSLANNTSKEQSAIIYQVGKTIGDDKTVKVYASIDNEDKNLLPGMYVNASIETANCSTTTLPSDAVLTFDDKNYIFTFFEKVKEGDKYMTRYKMVEVRKGVSNNGFTEVILPASFDTVKSKIVIKGAYNLLSALKNAGDMAC
ncbi:MAG: efflux RND transporter periplasmic adaptor subunit [Bacteroidota bacterium]